MLENGSLHTSRRRDEENRAVPHTARSFTVSNEPHAESHTIAITECGRHITLRCLRLAGLGLDRPGITALEVPDSNRYPILWDDQGVAAINAVVRVVTGR